jgi:hypothetical protein
MTTTEPRPGEVDSSRDLVEMAWDPITRIVGSLGIYTKIDFANRTVAECKSTSSIFRGYSLFMKGKDPRGRALHHQPDLRDLRGQPPRPAPATRRTWPTA